VLIRKKVKMAVLGSTLAATAMVSLGPISATDTEVTTIPATGTFTFTTAPGIAPAWGAAGITLTPITPTTLTRLPLTGTETLQMPVVAKTGSANALSGGFRLTNTKTRQVVNCFIPTLDTKARVLDCVTIGAGAVWETTKIFFAISKIQSWSATNSNGERTSTITGIEFVVPDSDTAKFFNTELSTTVFTTSVTIATGTMDVTRRITS
jgi:hypothetical protein